MQKLVEQRRFYQISEITIATASKNDLLKLKMLHGYSMAKYVTVKVAGNKYIGKLINSGLLMLTSFRYLISNYWKEIKNWYCHNPTVLF